MEPVGLGVGIAGLAGVFTACVDCFEYVQLGRQFGTDYGKCVLRLDAAKLRISRWGLTVGLGSEPYTKPQIPVSDKDTKIVQDLLEQIFETFEDTEKVLERFKKRIVEQNPDSTELLVHNTDSDIRSDY